jgi:tetratricopeptide (TPR) repeat protein
VTTRPIHELRSEALSAASRGDLAHARGVLFTALGHTIAREDEYAAATVDLRNVLARMGDLRGALSVDWYAGSERSQRGLSEKVAPVDRARTVLAWADRAGSPERARPLYAKAADEYEGAGFVARAAIARERAEDFGRARALWSRLAQVLSGSGEDLYAAALARFNLARTSRKTGDASAAREATVGAVHLLEEAGDRYETIGQRERAFDCYQVLIAVGRESGEFEHVLEGYVNVIRILREDHLRYYALQSYEEALGAAQKQGETAAAATLAREMASYARKEGLPAIANFGMLSQAKLWRDVARSSIQRGAPPEIAENALLAAVIAFGESGQFQRVAELYAELAELPLSDARKKHYQRAIARYQGASDFKIEASSLPAHLRHDTGYPDVWHVDLVEWEQQGSAAEACADIVLDPSWSEVTRRRALVGRLTALALEAHVGQGPTADAAITVSLATHLAEQLSQVELYTILSPLEHMFRRPEPQIRASVMRALARFMYKRTFITLRAGLSDPDNTVAEEAARAVEELRFPHAFDPLARIYRESPSARARAAALRALAKVDTVEAAEMLLGVIEHDGRDERAAAVEALKRARGTRFLDLARAQLPRLAGPAQGAVREVLQTRGMLG